jgi:CBS domain-containing protein
MQVSQLMSKKVEWIGPTVSLQEAARKMRDLDIGCLPVGEHDRLIGMITDRDIACRGFTDGKDASKTPVRDAMSAGITYCFDDQDVSEAAHLMEEKQIRRLPVLNRQKRLVGLLSMGDISQHATGRVSAEVLKAVTKHGHLEGTRPRTAAQA